MHIAAVSMGYSSGLLFSTSLALYSHAVTPISIVFNLSRFFYIVNIMLAVFNLLPVPPLDGSKILSVVLPPKYYFKMLKYENYIVIILLVLVFAVPGILFTIMSPLIWTVETAIRFIVMNTASLFL
jgi:Zn-dependent protease